MTTLNKKAVSLAEQLKRDEQSQLAQARANPREKSKKINKRSNEDLDDMVRISQKESGKILELAREQLINVEENVDDDVQRRKKRVKSAKQREDDDSSIEDIDGEEDMDDDEDEEEYGEGDDVFAEIDEADERAIAAFSRKNTTPGDDNQPRKTLGEIILEKLAEHNAQKTKEISHVADKPSSQLNPQVVEVYTSVGQLMSRYRAGKVPKAFKIIPALNDWEDVLALTHPERWSPQAMYQATRLFASNMNPRMAQKFYSSVLLPAIREDIQANKSLNYHHYMSLKKAIYKPASFFKGILFPLCEEECTLREASIVGSVLAKVSIPVVHSGAALLKLASLPYDGSTSVFLRVLINKKYSLPYRVVDTLVNHFCSFTNEERALPVLWHQALLVFVQRYKNVFSPEQKEAFRALLKNQNHKQLTAEIRREIFHQKE
jgi:essential nuclear protein 1